MENELFPKLMTDTGASGTAKSKSMETMNPFQKCFCSSNAITNLL